MYPECLKLASIGLVQPTSSAINEWFWSVKNCAVKTKQRAALKGVTVDQVMRIRCNAPPLLECAAGVGGEQRWQFTAAAVAVAEEAVAQWMADKDGDRRKLNKVANPHNRAKLRVGV